VIGIAFTNALAQRILIRPRREKGGPLTQDRSTPSKKERKKRQTEGPRAIKSPVQTPRREERGTNYHRIIGKGSGGHDKKKGPT